MGERPFKGMASSCPNRTVFLQLLTPVLFVILIFFMAHRQEDEVKLLTSRMQNVVGNLGNRFLEHTLTSNNLSLQLSKIEKGQLETNLKISSIHENIQQAAPTSRVRRDTMIDHAEMLDSGKMFKSCITLTLNSLVQSWSQIIPTESARQLKLMVERRMQLSNLVQKCGGQQMFTAAAAKSADDYISWAAAELKKDDGNKTKVVIIKTSDDAGMGNRLQAMISAFLFAIVTKRVLLIDWAVNGDHIQLPSSEKSAMPALDALFIPPYDWLVQNVRSGNVHQSLTTGSRASVTFNGHTHRGRPGGGLRCCKWLEWIPLMQLHSTYQDLLCRDVTQWFEMNEVVIIDGYDWFGPILANNQNHFASVFSSFGFNSFPGIFNGFFHPSADIQKVLDEYHLALFSKFYVIGVQLRGILRLSRSAEESVWRAMIYLKTNAEASQSKPVVFYVCADSKEPWDRIVDMFGKDIIFSASVSEGRIGRMSKEDIQYGVVDMYLLGDCDDLIISPESTFGGVAAGRLGKSSWRISKNPENWIDAAWEDKRVIAKSAGNSPCSFGWQFVPQTSCYNKLHFIPEQLNQENDLCRTL